MLPMAPEGDQRLREHRRRDLRPPWMGSTRWRIADRALVLLRAGFLTAGEEGTMMLATEVRSDLPSSVTRGARIFPGKYLSITSFRPDGSGVTTPVWFVQEGRRLLVETDSHSYKVRRIRHTPFVKVAP